MVAHSSLPTLFLCVQVIFYVLSFSSHAEASGSTFASSSNTVSSANGYQVSLSQADVDGRCIATLTILGNGIHKVAQYPCEKRPQGIINLNRTLLVGEHYFSDTPAVLVHLSGDRCEREIFFEKDGKIASTVEPMNEKDCELVRIKIKILKEQQERWNEWYKAQQQKAQEQLIQLQNNVAALQLQLFGGLLGTPPFG